MPRFSLLLVPTAAVAFAGFAPDARACGGLFCNGAQPVVQTGEGIVFAVDETEGTVDAIINIRYQGAAPEFAWVLPLQSAPTSVRVAPAFLFATMDRLTAPQFQTTFETRGTCADQSIPGVVDASVPQTGALDAGGSGTEGVQVLFRGAVGPYDSAVIQSSDPAELRGWLEENGYAVTDQMMEAVIPYVVKGDALLALKLLNGKSSGDIQPIWVTMQGNEVCVPIRLTAIASIEDMDITTLVLSNQGRAIPENYFHIELDLPRINWLGNGSNYRQLVSEAADQGSGNAFVTEFSGSARIFDDQLHRAGQFDRALIEETPPDASLVIGALQQQNLTIHPEVAAVLLEAIGEDALTMRGLSASQFTNCPGCFAGLLEGITVSTSSIAGAVWTRVVEPLQDLQLEFDSFSYATRLYTLLSPDEMMVDPDLTFRTDLPDVSNIHRARAVLDCTGGLYRSQAPLEINIEETGQIVPLMRIGSAYDSAYLDALPAAIRVEQLYEQRVVEDHRAYVDSVLEAHRQMVEEMREEMVDQKERERSACRGCRTSGGSPEGWIAGLIAIALVTSARRVSRRRR